MAQKYRKLDPRIWRDEKFATLTPDEKLVAVYCLTAQVNRCGIFVFSPAMAAEELGTSPQTFAQRFARVISALRWRWDDSTRVLYFPRWWRYNHPENTNVLKGCLSDLAELPQTPLLAEFYGNETDLTETFRETLRQRIPKPLPIQEQEQEQEQEQDKDMRRCRNVFVKPTLEEVTEYCRERGKGVDPEAWMNYYTANGWRVGRNPMKDWKAAIHTWEKNRSQFNGTSQKPNADAINAQMAAKYGSQAKAVSHE